MLLIHAHLFSTDGNVFTTPSEVHPSLSLYYRDSEGHLNLLQVVDKTTASVEGEYWNKDAYDPIFVETFNIDSLVGLISKEDDQDIKQLLLNSKSIVNKDLTNYVYKNTKFERENGTLITFLVGFGFRSKNLDKLITPLSDKDLKILLEENETFQRRLEDLAVMLQRQLIKTF